MKTVEDAIISETQALVENIKKMNQLVAETNDAEVVALIDKLRILEKKMSLVFTFFKASLYSLNMWQQEGQYVSSNAMDEDTNRPAIQL
ncbi:hypothetical protein K450DRAFT_277881 [Umbelopsis ramanniana AG]|uniref:DASH complex subunit DAD3 n=1 Tax=Umbelopsis ramanniana AG TaxID=1314678 RepID=A0AAD5HHF1_UMBRA|nr:uncharacterized protein K450DRAFT_277881 [Umbelopsis ramanniana AG]KAI8583004.1 hypothetical protein K450DRAFT_277881 [Umbelopsis ramanniana AG]